MNDQCVSHSSPQQRSAAQASTEVQRPNVIRCGWLRKQGGFVKTWHSRWFVLRGDQLCYYKDEEETKALVRRCMLIYHRHSRVFTVWNSTSDNSFWLLPAESTNPFYPLWSNQADKWMWFQIRIYRHWPCTVHLSTFTAHLGLTQPGWLNLGCSKDVSCKNTNSRSDTQLKNNNHTGLVVVQTLVSLFSLKLTHKATLKKEQTIRPSLTLL